MKLLSELNLLDRFLFDEAMEDPEVFEAVLSIVFGQKIHLAHPSQTEKEFRTQPDRRSIRVDVYAMDENQTVYDVESQKDDTKNLPRRSRYYEAQIDVSLLEPGEIDFNQLNDVIIIMICPFDLFGAKLYQYTFEMRCKEQPDIRLEDGAVRIFLNTKGTNREDVSDELIEFLSYAESSCAPGKEETTISENLKVIQRRINQIKSSEDMGVKYMQKWEEEAYIRKEGRIQGREEGEEYMLERVNKLIQALIAASRMDDIERMTKDPDYQKKLFQEFGL